MENGGFNNIEKLHMQVGDKARHKSRCSFYDDHYDFVKQNNCFYTGNKCIGSSHCKYYTTNSHKAIQMYDKKYSVHDSDKCEYISFRSRFPICKKECMSILCFGLGHQDCPKNEKLQKSDNNNIDVVEFCDSIKLYRYDENKKTHHYLTIKSIPVKPNLDIVYNFVGKKLGEEILFDNQVWKIEKIIKNEKSGKGFIVHKKIEKSYKENKVIICKFCKKRILAKKLVKHLKTEHPKNPRP